MDDLALAIKDDVVMESATPLPSNAEVQQFLEAIALNDPLIEALDKAASAKPVTIGEFCSMAADHGQPVSEEMRKALQQLTNPLQRLWYERAWHSRLQRIRQYKSEGYCLANRPLQKMLQFERSHRYAGGLSKGKYEERQFAPEEEKHGRMPTGKPPYRLTPVGENYVLAPRYRDMGPLLADFIEYNKLQGLPVIELGCGTGRNLFDLHMMGVDPKPRYFAGDWSPSALGIVEEIAADMPGMQVTPFRFDFTTPDFSAIATDQPVLVFTAHAIEQVHLLPREFFAGLTKACPKAIGVHMEPFGFQLTKKRGRVSEQHEQFMRQRKWNMNFLEMAYGAQQAGHLKVTHMYKNVCGGDPLNPGSLLFWRAGGA